MDELYKDFPVRDQDADLPHTLDLLQAWGAPAYEPLSARLRRGFVAAAHWLRVGSSRRGGVRSLR